MHGAGHLLLLQMFGTTRDEWIASDPKGWLGANRFYAGTDLSLGCPHFEAYIITTKQARFVEVWYEEEGSGGVETFWPSPSPTMTRAQGHEVH